MPGTHRGPGPAPAGAKAVALAVALGLACAAGVAAAQAGGWPDWVLNPPSEGELVGTDCVPASGNLSIDRQQLAAKARLVLAQQIEIRIEAMDETFASRAQEGREQRLAVSFKSASRQLVSTTLQGSRLVRVETVAQRDGPYLCGMVVLERARAEALPADVIRTAGAKVQADTEALLLARFRQVAAARAAPVGGRP